MCSKALHNDFHAPVMVNSTRKHKKPQFSIGKAEVRSRSGCEVPCLHGSKIHPLWPSLAQNSVTKRSIPATWRPKSCRYSIHPSIHSLTTDIVYRSPCFTLCYGWRVGIVHPKCHCKRIRDDRYRGGQLVTLN